MIILKRIIVTFPSRIIFGNCIPFLNNFLPLFRLYNFKKIFNKKNTLDKDGYIKISYNLEKNIIKNIKNHFNKDIINPKKTYFESERSKKKILLKNPLKIKDLDKIIVLFDNLLKEYFDGNYKIINVRAWRTYHDESKNKEYEKYIYSNYWHYDHYRTDMLKVFILLNKNTTASHKKTEQVTHESF